MPNKKKQLEKSRKKVNNEYYTLLEDIENEIQNYWDQLEGKNIWCNCDDPEWSEFHHYFEKQKAFHKFNVKYSHYELIPKNKKGFKEIKVKDLVFDRTNDGDFIKTNKIWVDDEGFCEGDFRSSKQKELWKWADVIITNPPFSLFREFIDKIYEYKKNFIIIGPQNAISYKNVFSKIKENKLWLGYNFHLTGFWMVDETGKKVYLDSKKSNGAVPRACCWYTNLDVVNRHKKLILSEEYDKNKYPKYDNYDAINVNTTKEIPCDYFGKMGVPITFINKYNPDQFEIVTLGVGEHNFTPTKKYKPFRLASTGEPSPDKRDFLLYIRDPKGKYLTSEGYTVTKCYARIIIKRKK